MKKTLTLFLIVSSLSANPLFATISYSFTALAGSYTPNAGGTSITELYAGADAVVSASYPIGFNFMFDGTLYSTFKVSDNGCFFFGGDSVTTSDPAFGDAIIPNDLSIANTTRPFAAPLWDDLAVWGGASYLLTGNAPNRILTIEWSQMDWMYNVTSPAACGPTCVGGHDNVSFQVKLYETTNVIEFIYNQESGSLASCGCLGSASIGLAGISTGDYYSLDTTSGSPIASKTINTTSIYTEPATGQIYRWTPMATGVEQTIGEIKNISVFPNPSSGTFNFYSSQPTPNQKIYLMVYNVFGEIISDELIALPCNIDISSQPKGVYFYKLTNVDKENIYTGKIIIK